MDAKILRIDQQRKDPACCPPGEIQNENLSENPQENAPKNAPVNSPRNSPGGKQTASDGAVHAGSASQNDSHAGVADSEKSTGWASSETKTGETKTVGSKKLGLQTNQRPKNSASGGQTTKVTEVDDATASAAAAKSSPLNQDQPDLGFLQAKIVELVEFAKQRMSGEYEVDDFGFDPQFTEKIIELFLKPLYDNWFRVEVRGIENIPAVGGALIVANHSGTIPLDALMTQAAIHLEHPNRRSLRTLGADLLFKTPIVSMLARKTGATLAANADAQRLLETGHLVGVWPEGYKGIGKPFSERYKLQRFGRGGFVSAAIKTKTPIIPCSIVGAEEIYPIVANMPSLARIFGIPFAPVTPTWPWLGPLGLVPLPSKWLIEFGEPIKTDQYEKTAADDPMLVFELTDMVRETIQQTLYDLLMARRSVFF